MTTKMFVCSCAFVVAQGLLPQSACDGKKPPVTGGPDPWANVPISESMTTADGVRIGVQVVVTGLDVPWSLVFAPDGRLFVTERRGNVRIVQDGVLRPQPALTLTNVHGGGNGEGGVLGIALHPNFAQNKFVYIAYTTNRDGEPLNRIVRGRESNNLITDLAVIVDNLPGASGHDGGRLRFGPDGKLYLTVGDTDRSELAQMLSVYAGKILRFNEDGTTPADNPYGSPVWTYGHRHPQGIDWHPQTGQMWATEHGSVGNDELNVIVRGGNYGWPDIQGTATRAGMVSPALVFPSSVAPSGMSFYRSTRIRAFVNNIFFATLAGSHIHRVRLTGLDQTVGETERLFETKFGRIRDVITGPDGALYFCTSNRDGRFIPIPSDDRIARIVPIQ